MADGGDIPTAPFTTIGADQLGSRLGSSIKCPICGEMHAVEDSVGTHTDANGNVTERKGTLQFYKCDGKTYLAGIVGREIRQR